MDSRNIEVLNINEFEINSFVEKRANDIRQLTGRPPTTEFAKQYLKHNLFDLRMLLNSLESIIYNDSYDLREFWIKREIHGILKNFTSYFDGVLTSKPNDEDTSRSANLKRRLLSIKDDDTK